MEEEMRQVIGTRAGRRAGEWVREKYEKNEVGAGDK
jgi:hypothetical protein